MVIVIDLLCLTNLIIEKLNHFLLICIIINILSHYLDLALVLCVELLCSSSITSRVCFFVTYSCNNCRILLLPPSLTAVKTPQKTRFWQLDLVLLLQHTKAVSIKVCHNAQPRRLTYLIAVFNISICLVATHTVQHETGTRERRLRKKSTQTGERLAKR